MFLFCLPTGLPVSTYAKFCHRKLQKVAITGGKKVSRKNRNRIVGVIFTRSKQDESVVTHVWLIEVPLYWDSKLQARTVGGRDINSPHQLNTAADTVSCSLTYAGGKSSFTSHPSRVYVSPPWRRSTTVGGLLSHPPCLAVLWRRWWSDRANSSQTGNCPGCRFSFPSMCWAWAGLRPRASSGKTTPKSAVGERWKLRYYKGD